MRRFEISADGFPTQQLECSGCSGDALTLALADTAVQQWKVNRHGSNEGIEITVGPAPGPSAASYMFDPDYEDSDEYAYLSPSPTGIGAPPGGLCS